MADRGRERAERNRDLLAGMLSPPNKAQVLAEIEVEIGNLIELATESNFIALTRQLRRAQLEAGELRRRPDLKGKP